MLTTPWVSMTKSFPVRVLQAKHKYIIQQWQWQQCCKSRSSFPLTLNNYCKLTSYSGLLTSHKLHCVSFIIYLYVTNFAASLSGLGYI
uniref:Uncharacterized protein n=1 Tax=Anguilla anguilla TaxID=7936 RepID=A0A0E9XXC4_ANGAN